MQGLALGATDTSAAGVLCAWHSATHPRLSHDSDGYDETGRRQALTRRRGRARVLVKIFETSAGGCANSATSVEAENNILKAPHSSLRMAATVGCHHTRYYIAMACLVTAFAVAFAQHLGLREDDPRPLGPRWRMLHDVGNAVHSGGRSGPAGALTDQKWTNAHSSAPRYEALSAHGGFPPEILT